MTNQEVAKSLKNIRDLYPWGEKSYKTLDYAIRAVVELPKRRKEAKRWRAKAHQIAGESYENGYLAGQKNVAERCENAISKADVKNAIYKVCLYEENKDIFVKILDEINKLSSVKQEPKTGHWITTRTFMHDGEYYCDKCKCESPNNEKWDYCPNCGARMESENKE